MLTSDQLAAILQGVNVAAVARESGVSTKTIYRLRNKQHEPVLRTVHALIDAIERLQPAKKPRKAKQ
jgi:DNA-binding phage protein